LQVLPAPQSDQYYKPASGPAYATATNVDELNSGLGLAQARFDPIPYPSGDLAGVPAEQRGIQEAVFNGANSYRPDVNNTQIICTYLTYFCKAYYLLEL
jgi:hypothetical protein